MIDRSYLPFRSARLYQDRKMAKWMGFFLSEHTSALEDAPTLCDRCATIVREFYPEALNGEEE